MASTRPLANAPRGRQSGFTLIEVMVALIVLVLGVLGAAAMTLNAIRDTKQSGLRSQASAMAYELADIIRVSGPANETVVFLNNAPGAVGTCWTSGCSETDMARNEFYEWQQKLVGPFGLPGGQAVVCRDASNLDVFPTCDNDPNSNLVVKLQWDEKNPQGASTAVTARVLTVPITINY